MPFQTSSHFNRPTGITTRILTGTHGSGAAISYPDDFDDVWRFMSIVGVEFNKTGAATATMRLHLQREGFATVMVLWERFMELAEVTTSPAALQGAEWVGADNDYWVAPAAITASGIIIPPRTKIELVSANATTTLSAILHEALDLALLRGLT